MRIFLLLMHAVVMAQTVSLPAARVRHLYTAGPLASAAVDGCAMPIPVYRVVEGDLPRGLRLLGGGYLRGQAERVGEHRFEIVVDNGCSKVKQPYSLSVRAAAVLAAVPDRLEIAAAKSAADKQISREAPVTIVVSSDWPGLAYTVTTDAAWVVARPLRGRTSYPEEALAGDPVEIAVEAQSLEPGDHRAQIRISSHAAAAPLVIPLTVAVVR